MSIEFDNTSEAIVDARGLAVSLLDPVDAERHPIVNADLTLCPGTVTAIVGASGGGKSTIAATLAGLLPVSSRVKAESLYIDSHRCWNPERKTPVSGEEFKRVVLGPQQKVFYYISQHARSTLVPNQSVRWHFEWAERSPLRDQSSEQGKRSIDEGETWAETMTRYCLGDSERAERIMESMPHQLSTGECQRVSFAIAEMIGPKVLVADEPFASLDPDTAKVLVQDLRKYVECGGALLLVTHQLRLLQQLEDLGMGMVLDDGEIVDQLPLDHLLRGGPLARQTAKLFHVASRRFGESTKSGDAEPVIEVKKLSKHFGDRSVFSNQSFQVPNGSRFGIEGPSGGGKTTLARILLSLESENGGEVICFGESCSGKSISRAQRVHLWRQIQMATQDTDLVFDFNEIVGDSVVRAIRDQPNALNKSQAWSIASSIFSKLGLSPQLLLAPPSRLSGGERKRAAIARSLALLGFQGETQPMPSSSSKESLAQRVLILDEPTVGLDIFHQGMLAETLCDAQQQMNLTLIVMSHDHDFLERFCDTRIVWPMSGQNLEPSS